jgi:hypothetical protein
VLQIAGKGVEKTGVWMMSQIRLKQVWMMSQIKVAMGVMICVKYIHKS